MRSKSFYLFSIFLVMATLFLGFAVGNATAEAFENIDAKDVATKYVMRDIEHSFTFRNEGIDITYINISTDLNVGDVKTIVESLKSTSSMISTPAEGRVYKNINIWVGEDELKYRLINSDVGFRVDRTWLEDNGVSENSVRLSIYRSGNWYVLPTEKTDEDDEYIYYEAPTSGDLRTHFAIVEYIESEPVLLDTAEEAVAEDSLFPEPTSEESALDLEGDADIVASESAAIDSDVIIFFFAIPVLMVLIVLSTSSVGLIKGKHTKARDGDFVPEDEKQVAEEKSSEATSDSMNAQTISSPTAETSPHDKVSEVQPNVIEEKINLLEDSGIISDVVHKH